MRSGQEKLEKQAKGLGLRLGARTKARNRDMARARCNWTGPLCNRTSGNATGWSVM